MKNIYIILNIVVLVIVFVSVGVIYFVLDYRFDNLRSDINNKLNNQESQNINGVQDNDTDAKSPNNEVDQTEPSKAEENIIALSQNVSLNLTGLRDDVSVTSTKEGNVILKHVTDNKVVSCDMRGDAEPENLVDLNFDIRLSSLSLVGAFSANESEVYQSYISGQKIIPDGESVKSITFNGLQGYELLKAVEDCGVRTYYFPIGTEGTLIIDRTIIQPFSVIRTDREANLALPGVMLPEEEAQMFEIVLQGVSEYRY